MKDYLIAERYARGLSESIADNAELDAVAEVMGAFAALYGENHDLRSVLTNPAIDVEKRVEVLHQLLGDEGTPDVVTRLVEIMVRRGRVTLLADVTQVFKELADERLNRITADVASAAPLDDGQCDRVRSALQQHTDKEVRLDCRVDQELLGGVRAQIGDKVYDGSLRTRLKNMKEALLAEG